MPRRHLLCAAVLAVALPLAGCTSSPADPEPLPPPTSSDALRLVSYDSCKALEKDLKEAAKASVGPYGFPGSGVVPEVLERGGARTMADAPNAAAGVAQAPAAPGYSSTNNHEQDADEPDIVKTDGKRIVTVADSVLRVVDVATRKQTGELTLGLAGYGSEPTLLLSGNAVLVMSSGAGGGAVIDRRRPGTSFVPKSRAILVDIGGAPRIVSRWEGDGGLVDARLIGGTARVVLRSAPRITFPFEKGLTTDNAQLTSNRKAIDQADVSAWLPQWTVTTGTGTQQGHTDCTRVTRPPDFSAGALLSILTFDLAQPALGSGDAVTVAADSDTVYATGNSLYVAADQRWRQLRGTMGTTDQKTDLYRFTITGKEPPVYTASGQVPGYLVNQYAMSEWDGKLRVATTSAFSGSPAAEGGESSSAVRVLSEKDGKLTQTGVVDGLGKGEKIYSVRFIGPVGYVVTFRQTDPLYTVDLSDPAKPRVTGELKITGYSAHLQPAGDGRLIGVGQEAGTDGRTTGTQVSLFDVSDPAAPERLAQHQVPGAQSEAEWDPHALLWWPATQLLVLPFNTAATTGATSGSLALRVTDQGVTEAGTVSRPGVRRSLVIGAELWSVSPAGLQVSALSTVDELAWLPN